MDFLKINENLTKVSKFLYESNDYKLTIITGRDRDSDGVLQNITIKAENDLDALLQVFKGYDLQNAGMFNGEYTDEDLTEEDKQLKERILNCVKENKIEEGVKLLTDLYFDNFDISDYYADIVKLEAPDGHIVIEDDIDVEEWFGDDYEDEEIAPKEKSPEEKAAWEARVQRAKEYETLCINMVTELQKETDLELEDKLPFAEGVTVYLNLPKIAPIAVCTIKSDSSKDVDTAFYAGVMSCDDPEMEQKNISNVSIEQVKKFLLDNYSQMEARAQAHKRYIDGLK